MTSQEPLPLSFQGQGLWHRSVEQGEVGETKALRILRAYWQRHVISEDALRPLLELLGKRECFGEAQDCYQQLCRALAAEGKQPDQRTRELAEFVRAMQIRRQPGIETTATHKLPVSFLPLSSQRIIQTAQDESVEFSWETPKNKHRATRPDALKKARQFILSFLLARNGLV
jgi:hypothetical protein